MTATKLLVRVQLVDCNGDALDISGASSVRLYFQAPDGNTHTVMTPSVQIVDALQGIIEYEHSASDFPLVNGLHKFAGSVVWASGKENIGETLGTFRVKGLSRTRTNEYRR